MRSERTVDCRKRQEIKTTVVYRCSKHMIKRGNSFGQISAAKHQKLIAYVDACREYAIELLDAVFKNGYGNFKVDFSGKMKYPTMMRYTAFDGVIKSNLSGRSKNQIIKQVQPIISNWIREWNYWFGKSEKDPSIDLSQLKKLPKIKNFEPSSMFCDVKIDGENAFLELKALGEFGIKHGTSSVLRIPFKLDKRTIKKRIEGGWTLSSAAAVSKTSVILSWEKEFKKKTKSNNVVGCDQGINSVISLGYSDGDNVISFQPVQKDNHGWSLSKIVKRMRRCKKGSKQYARYQKLRANYIRWSINQAKEWIKENCGTIRLEDIRFMGLGSNRGSFLSKFEHSLIRSKLSMVAEENGVFIELSSNAYRSQRCSICGFVHEKNRKKGTKRFVCLNCGNMMDADINAALNHSINLDPKKFGQIDNKNGEFWPELGSQLGVNSVPNDPEPLVCA